MICAANIELPTEPAYPLLYCDDFENPEESLITAEEYENKYLDMTIEIYKGKYAVRMDVKTTCRCQANDCPSITRVILLSRSMAKWPAIPGILTINGASC